MKYLFAVALSLFASSVYADAFQNPPPATGVSQGTVQQLVGSDGYARPISATNPMPVTGTLTTTPGTGTQNVQGVANGTPVPVSNASEATALAALSKGPTTAAIISFGATCATTAAALASNTFTQGFVLAAGTANTGKVFVGGSNVNTTIGAGGTGYPLVAGQPISYGAANSNQTYFICANTTDTIAVTGN